MSRNLTWPEAIKQVLHEAGEALHYTEITERILSQDLKRTKGATPDASVSATLSESLKKEGAASPFVKVSRGTYMLARESQQTIASSSPEPKIPAEPDREEQYAVVSSFGMFWRRGLVDWKSSAVLMGHQKQADQNVDFADQRGIYLLYDGREVIYVGRSTDRPLGQRLYEHTRDRMAARWDRFSWFGFRPVSEDGGLGTMPGRVSAGTLIAAFEAVLIEALEPRQNRRRGDDLEAAEFLQVEDEDLRMRRDRAAVERLINRRTQL